MDEQVRDIVQKIVDAVRPRRIILFGSRATGQARPDSDIDLLLICDKPVSKREVKLRVRRLFSWPDFSLDLFVLTPEEFEWQKGVVSTLARIASQQGIVCHGE